MGYIKNVHVTNCGGDGIFEEGNPRTYYENVSVTNVGRDGLVCGDRASINGYRAHNVAGVALRIRAANVDQRELQAIARQVAEMEAGCRADFVAHQGISRWAKDNGIALAQLVAALVQIGLSLR